MFITTISRCWSIFSWIKRFPSDHPSSTVIVKKKCNMFSTGNTPKRKLPRPHAQRKSCFFSQAHVPTLRAEVCNCVWAGGRQWLTECVSHRVRVCSCVSRAHIVCSLSHSDCGPCPQNCALASLNRLAHRFEGSTQGCVILTLIIWLPMEYQRSELSHLTCLICFLWFQQKKQSSLEIRVRCILANHRDA